MPAFLPEDILIDARVEHCVYVDVNEIVKIAQIAASDGVAGLVGKGECVEKGLQRSLHQFHKGFLDGIFVRPAKNGVLQNVGNTCGVGWRRAKVDAKALVFVRVINGKQLRPRGLVPPQTGGAVHFVQMLFCKKSESVLVHDESWSVDVQRRLRRSVNSNYKCRCAV